MTKTTPIQSLAAITAGSSAAALRSGRDRVVPADHRYRETPRQPRRVRVSERPTHMPLRMDYPRHTEPGWGYDCEHCGKVVRGLLVGRGSCQRCLSPVKCRRVSTVVRVLENAISTALDNVVPLRPVRAA